MRILIVVVLCLKFAWVFNQDVIKTEGNPASENRIECGDFTRIFDQGINENEKWYINDHCFIQATTGKWHMFGITHEEPLDPMNEINFAHATADSLLQQPWSKEAFALTAHREDPWKEWHLWAPHVIFHDGLYYMFYCAGGETNTTYKIHLATSSDLKSWVRHPFNPMVIDGFDARDPQVIHYDGKWIMYYTATRPVKKGNHVVMAVESEDLVNWSNKQVVYTDPYIGTFGGPTESPFVVCRNNKFYLFVCTNNPYDNTAVYESYTPYHWETLNRVADFPAHCAEVIQVDNDWYLSRAGWGKGGLYIAKLKWND